MLGEKWKTLSEKQRAPYEAKAAADKKRYEEEKAAYAVSLAIICGYCPPTYLYRLARPTRRKSLSRRVVRSPSSRALLRSDRLVSMTGRPFRVSWAWDVRLSPM